MVNQKWPEEIYGEGKIKDLILIALYSFNKEKVSFYRLLNKCFCLFPAKFSFEKNPDWPDSRKLDRALRSLRQKTMIKGSPTDGFSLVRKGRKRALEILNLFRQRKLNLK